VVVVWKHRRKVQSMDFYIDIGVAVMLRVLKDRRRRKEFYAVFRKVYNAIGNALVQSHVDWDGKVANGDAP